MASFCRICGRPKHPGLCDMVELTDGRTVHASRVDNYDGDIRSEIDQGQVKVENRWIKREEVKKAKVRKN